MYLARRNSNHSHALEWVPAQDGNVPDGAVEAGCFGGRGGEQMYVGRVKLDDGNIVPGKCHLNTEGTITLII